MTAEEIIETIMTQHWDIGACRCWICEEAHKLGLGAREKYLAGRTPDLTKPGVHVDQPGVVRWTPR